MCCFSDNMIFQLWNVKDAEDEGLVPGLGRSPGGGNGSPLQYSYLGNPPDSGAWRAKSTESQKSQTRLSPRASTHTHTHTQCQRTLSSNKILQGIEPYKPELLQSLGGERRKTEPWLIPCALSHHYLKITSSK